MRQAATPCNGARTSVGIMRGRYAAKGMPASAMMGKRKVYFLERRVRYSSGFSLAIL